ncbi:MAG: ribosome silencing factor [Polyangiaceae bacterium]
MGTKRKDDEGEKADTSGPKKGTRSATSAHKPAAKRPAGRVASSVGRAGSARPRIRATHGSTLGMDGGAPKPARGRSSAARPLAPRAPKKAWRSPDEPRERPTHDRTPASARTDGPRTDGARAAAPKRRSAAPPPEPSSATKEIALAIASAGLDKKALGIEVLDVTGRVDYADYLVIMTGSSDRHVLAIASGIEEALAKKNHKPLSVEGLGQGTWVLIDFDDVVVHVFQEETRRVYDIEGLWVDARRLEIAEPSRRP